MRYEEVSFKECDLYMCQPLDLYLFQRTVLKTEFSFSRRVCVSLSLGEYYVTWCGDGV